jgi:hypothetical protein
MNTKQAILALVSAFSLQLSALVVAAPLGTAFTYQGSLNDGGSPATGLYDFRAAVYDAATEGTVVSAVLTNAATPVTNGLFSMALDFGASHFAGQARWLELAVRTNGSGAFTNLSPRHELTPRPYALYAPQAATAATASNVVTGAVSASGLNTPAGPSAGEVLGYNRSSLVWMPPSFAGSISGFVREGSNDVTFAQVFIPGLSVVAFVGPANASMHPYQLLSVPPGSHWVTARLPNGRTDSTQVVVTAGQALTEVNFLFPLFYRDADGDGYGNWLVTINTVTPPPGWVAMPGDFDDACATCYPGAPEICDGKDNDGDGLVDEGMPDTDGDGLLDCMDNCPLVFNPDQEDLDDDGIGDVCDPDKDGDGWTVAQDCDDWNPDRYPGAQEVCNSIDDDCDGRIDEDEGVPGCTVYYFDNDGDGYGVTGESRCLCRRTGKYTALVGGDCDDNNGNIYPGQGCP